MSLDQFNDIPEEGASSRNKPGGAELLAKSALYELDQSAYGLAQVAGLQDRVGELARPKEADSRTGRFLQSIGRGAGDLLPTLAAGAVSRFAFGKILEHSGSAESFAFKRTAIGLSLAESASTGALTGALLKPTDGTAADSLGGLVGDRVTGGASSALSFALLGLTAHGWNRFASSETVARFGADTILKNAMVTGAASGAVGGLVNLQLNSVITDGKFTTDSGKIADSVVEIATMSALFGGTARTLGFLRSSGVSSAGAQWQPSEPAHRSADLSFNGTKMSYLTHGAKVFRDSSVHESIASPFLDLDPSSDTWNSSQLHHFVDGNPSKRSEIAQRIFKDGYPSYDFDQKILLGIERMYDHLSAQGDYFDRFIKLDRDDPHHMADFVDKEPVRHTALIKVLLDDPLNRKSVFDSTNLNALSVLTKQMGKELAELPTLSNLYSSSSDLWRLAKFIDFDSPMLSL